MGEVIEIADRCICQMFTTKRVTRPPRSRRCHPKGLYHVWCWRGGLRAAKGRGQAANAEEAEGQLGEISDKYGTYKIQLTAQPFVITIPLRVSAG